MFFLLLISLDWRKESSSCIPTPHHFFSLYQNTWLFEGIANELLRSIFTGLSISLFITKSGIRLNLTLLMWSNASHFWQLNANKQNIHILKNNFGLTLSCPWRKVGLDKVVNGFKQNSPSLVTLRHLVRICKVHDTNCRSTYPITSLIRPSSWSLDLTQDKTALKSACPK